MKVNPALVEWIELTKELVEALDESHKGDIGHVNEYPQFCKTVALIDRARRRLARVAKMAPMPSPYDLAGMRNAMKRKATPTG